MHTDEHGFRADPRGGGGTPVSPYPCLSVFICGYFSRGRSRAEVLPLLLPGCILAAGGLQTRRRAAVGARGGRGCEHMGLVSRVYFNAVFGALGGLLGWMLFGIFGDKNSSSGLPQLAQMLLGGCFIGGSIGYLVVSVEAIRDGALIRIARLATYGVVLGGLGGA